MGEHVAGTVPPWSVHGDELITHYSGWLDAASIPVGPPLVSVERIPGLAGPLLRVADHLAPRHQPLR